jgi:DNA-binding transcriptional MocR family regulator
MTHQRKSDRRDALVAAMLADLRAGLYPPGTRLPSVRRWATQHRVSPHTAAEAYNALAASGRVVARPGSGYFAGDVIPAADVVETEVAADALWERRVEAPGDRIRVDAGGGWLPTPWQYLDGVAAALRHVARAPSHSEGYGSPNGFEPLRAHFARQLAMRQVSADSGRIVLTQGASQALDLAVRALLEPGDVVVVEDPAYPPTLELLRARGVRLVDIARLATGPDVEALARILKLQRIRAVFTNTTLQNPTGTSTTRDVALSLIKLAQTYDFTIVEDDIFAELSPSPVAPIAAFDDGHHVLYVSSISKTVSPTLRVGYVLTGPTTLAPIIRLKTLSALASSELSERVAFAALTHPHYRRHLSALRRRLAVSQERVQTTLVTHGVDLKYQPNGGMFLWGRLRSALPVGKLWQNAVDAGVLLAPGESFCPDGRASPWWRFNVAHCEDRALTRFLASLRGERKVDAS